MQRDGHSQIGPGVARLLLVQAAAFVALSTVFTAPVVAAGLQFDPALLAARPWTLVTYALVHDSLGHLLVTSLLLVALGPTVERQMGTVPFLLYYVYCTVGAAVCALLLTELLPLPPLSGAMAGALGLLYAAALYEGDREIVLAPLPLEARVVMLAAIAGALALVVAAVQNAGALSLGHVTAFGSAWLFFRIRNSRQPALTTLPMPPVRTSQAPTITPRDDLPRAVLRAMPATQVAPETPAVAVEDPAETLNRLLDKISATGLESLTADERQLLTELAERRKTHD